MRRLIGWVLCRFNYHLVAPTLMSGSVWTPGGANDLDGVASGANRILAEGEDLDVTMTTAAASTLVGGCVTVTLRVTGQPTAWAATLD